MINKKKIADLLKHIEEVSAEGDSDEVEEQWDEIVDILSANLKDTKEYLSGCNENELWLIAGYFEDISGAFQSQEFVGFLHELEKKHPDLDLKEDIKWAEKALL